MSSAERARYRLMALPRFEKDLENLDRETRRRVISTLAALEDSPYSFKALHGDLRGKHTMRVGDYRIIYAIDESSKTVYLMTCRHRRRAYR